MDCLLQKPLNANRPRVPPDNPGNHTLETAAVEIANRTDIRVDIKVFPVGQIGRVKEILNGMSIAFTLGFASANAGDLGNKEIKAMRSAGYGGVFFAADGCLDTTNSISHPSDRLFQFNSKILKLQN